MGVGKGYKQTDIGVIPENWELQKLGDIAVKIGSGKTPTGGERVYKSSGRPFIRSQNVGWGRLNLDDIAFIDDTIHSTFSATEIKLNDVLLNITGASIGRSAVADERIVNGNVNQHVCIIRPSEKGLNPYFLNSFLLSYRGQKLIDSFQAGGNRQGLNFGQIRTFQIPFPPTVEEQSAIAAALIETDILIDKLEKIIEKKQSIKQGVMQKILEPKDNWEKKKLKEVCLIFKGKGLSKSAVSESGWKSCILYGELFTTYNEVIKSIKSRTSNDVGINSKSGDILFPGSTTTTGADLAKCSALMIDNVLLGGDIIILRSRKNLYNPIFVSYFLNSKRVKEIAGKTKGITIHHLYGSDLSEIDVEFPSIEEQDNIAIVLCDIDEEIKALKLKLKKYRQIQEGMMQQLLTGKIRLL